MSHLLILRFSAKHLWDTRPPRLGCLKNLDKPNQQQLNPPDVSSAQHDNPHLLSPAIKSKPVFDLILSSMRPIRTKTPPLSLRRSKRPCVSHHGVGLPSAGLAIGHEGTIETPKDTIHGLAARDLEAILALTSLGGVPFARSMRRIALFLPAFRLVLFWEQKKAQTHVADELSNSLYVYIYSIIQLD